jgi:hypothetical protein
MTDVAIQPVLFGMEQTAKTSDDYYTPGWVFERMGIEFDLDVCSPPGGLPWIPARRFFTMADDGLAQPWAGRVWMNPPFSDCSPWVRRFVDHANGVAVVQVSKTKHSAELWECVDAVAYVGGFVFVEPPGHVRTHHAGAGQVYMPCWFAAFGDECVEAISRLGRVRR